MSPLLPPRGTYVNFWGPAGYCRLWILGVAEIAKPLYMAAGGNGLLVWTDMEEQAFQNRKKALTEAPALALPDLSKPFHLFVHESQGVTKGVLTQTLGPWHCPVAYLSKRLDPVVSGWPSFLRAMAATASLVQEADKLTVGQNSALTAPHAVETLLHNASGKWMSNARILQYQNLLLDQPRLPFSPTRCSNPATLLPDPYLTTPVHDGQELLETTETGHLDQQDVPLEKADATVFTDGSSFLKQGVQKAGVAVTTETDTVWAQALLAGTSVNCSHSGPWVGYAFATFHVHGAIYQECRLLTSAGKTIKNKKEILALLEAIWLPLQVAVIYCKGHQKENTAVAEERPDPTAGKAAKLWVTPLTLLPTVSFPQPDLLNHPVTLWKKKSKHQIFRPVKTGTDGGIKLAQLLRSQFKIPHLQEWTNLAASRCMACVNARQGPKPELCCHLRGCSPGERWEIDIREITPHRDRI
ncbi:LOW QUALITY PROTEIN: Gag-Pol polyprotein [Plecturocebus cupreus]